MNKLLFILLIIVSANSFATVPSLNEVRQLYQKAVTDKKSFQKLR
jgi:hypothetical protein